MNFAFVVAAACDLAVEGIASELSTVTTGGALVSAAVGAAAGLKKAVIEVEQNPPLRWFLCHFRYCRLHRLVPGCDSTRYCHHLPVTIGCPSERFLINIHEWAARWASSRIIFRPCASQTASLSSLGFTMSNTTRRREVRIHRSTPRSAHVRP